MTKPIKIKTQTVYETEDGEEFESLADATLHQIKCDTENAFEAVQASSTIEDYARIVNYIWRNRIHLINALNEGDRMYEQALRDDSMREEGMTEGDK